MWRDTGRRQHLQAEERGLGQTPASEPPEGAPQCGVLSLAALAIHLLHQNLWALPDRQLWQDVLFCKVCGHWHNDFISLLDRSYKIPHTGGLKQQNWPSDISGGWKSRIKVSAGLVPLRPRSLAGRRPSSPCVFTWSPLCVCLWPNLFF